MIAETLRLILSQSGYAALAAYDPESAMELADTMPPDVLLTDFLLPEMNGVMLGISITERCPGCKVIVFSGMACIADMSREIGSAGRNFVLLEKPAHPEVLLARIDELLRPGVPQGRTSAAKGRLPLAGGLKAASGE